MRPSSRQMRERVLSIHLETFLSEVNLANIKESPIISESEVLRRINMVERSDQREEVERNGMKNFSDFYFRSPTDRKFNSLSLCKIIL